MLLTLSSRQPAAVAVELRLDARTGIQLAFFCVSRQRAANPAAACLIVNSGTGVFLAIHISVCGRHASLYIGRQSARRAKLHASIFKVVFFGESVDPA